MDSATIRRIAVHASETDPATVRKYLAGHRVQPVCHRRISQALRELGLASYVRDPVALDTSPATRA